MRSWTPGLVESWLVEAHDVMLRMPDLDQRYLRNSLRSRMPEVVETTATAFAASVAAVAVDGKYPDTQVRHARPGSSEIDRMEVVLLGIPKPYLGINGNTPWLAYLTRKFRRVVWHRVKGDDWHVISGREQRSRRTCQRWFREALSHIADELITDETGVAEIG